MEPSEISEKLIEYITLVDDTLQPLLAQKRAEYEKYSASVCEWKELHEQLYLLNEHKATHWKGSPTNESPFPAKPYRMLTDIGAGFRQHVEVDYEHTVAINVGADCFVEMNLAEALSFCKSKIDYFERLLDEARVALISVQSDLMVALVAIKTLQSTSS